MEDTAFTVLEHKGYVTAAWLALVFIGERVRPAVTRLGGWRRILRNAGLWGLNIGLSLVLVVPLSHWAADTTLDWRPGWLEGWTGLVVDVIVLDCLIYWWHRANHVVPVLWRFHEVHHLDEFLDVSTSVRFHFGEVALSACFRALVILLFDMSIMSILVFEALVLILAAFQHSNLRLAPRLEQALSLVLVTPSIHWVHHHAVRSDTDSNYATILSVWDRAFGSRSRTRRSAGMKLGVEQTRDTGLAGLLVRPFLPGALSDLRSHDRRTSWDRR